MGTEQVNPLSQGDSRPNLILVTSQHKLSIEDYLQAIKDQWWKDNPKNTR